MSRRNNGLVVGSHRWLAIQLLKYSQFLLLPHQPPVWKCPVCRLARDDAYGVHHGITQLDHLNRHTQQELKDTWLTQTLAAR